MTDNFNIENFIGNFLFGKLYRGFLHKQSFTIKIWDTPNLNEYMVGNHELRLMDELIMLRHERLVHPGIVSLYGYCRDKECIAVVYNLKCMNSLYNLLLKEDFTWVQRIKVAFAFACILKFLQARLGDLDPFVIRNLAAEHVILDEEYNPKLVDFSMITGGIFPNRHVYSNQPAFGFTGYADYELFEDKPAQLATWTKKCDVYAFGVMLLRLVSKRFIGEEEYDQINKSLVHKSFHADPCFYDVDGNKLSKLGVNCTSYSRKDRPSIMKIVKSFLQLRIFNNQNELLNKKLIPYIIFDTGKIKTPLSDIRHRDIKIDKLFKYVHNNDIMRFTARDLKEYTFNFSKRNYIGKFQFGKLFRGVYKSCVSGIHSLIVKIWDNDQNLQHNLLKLGDEMLFLHHEKYTCHPGMVRMWGYCIEDEKVAIVFILKVKNSMHNLLLRDSFKWLHRIKAACGVASLLKFLHTAQNRMDPFIIRNVCPTHILLDEEFNPKLVDFGMIVGGIFPSLERQDQIEPTNYIISKDIRDTCTTKDDVLSFGLLLQCLISEKIKIELNDSCLAISSNAIKNTFVHPKLQIDPKYNDDDGQEITRLVVQCVQPDSTCRPTMSEVLEVLQKLKMI
ncbi:serine/threonine-protein kinase PBL13-like [Impatiens glandulifera]|uniref:serine/threonine-protein kinase PBL13-like n=1 Tax=Impatiens glandulifera TaxID=253017 RepID=UPI001FB156FE|nr:serine/threonine-protein kinase PBL13-like [Impatiens glandulifera]